ncbi:MAG TPA: sugar-binding domain-containing protein [Solirubrobacteraceae bacterium]|nr:sugar-binding domain-containing protein [Solirubrobacteraceae bacterium]
MASLYYLEDATQAEIAAALGLSRPKVARLLGKARAEGIVEISIRTHPALNLPLEAELAQRFGLSQAILVADQPDEQLQRALAARAVAELLARMLPEHGAVAVGMGRNVGAVPEQLTNPTRREVTFVSAIGSSPQVGANVNSGDACRKLAERFGGRAEILYAPPYADNTGSRAAFLRHVDVRETLAHAAAAQFAVVGVGDARDDGAVVQMGCFSNLDMARMRKAGAVGDILGYFFDVDGEPVADSVVDRVVGLDAGQLRAIPQVVAMTSEAGKELAVLGALRTGIIDVLVTSLGTARGVLAQADAEERPAARQRR